MSALPPPDLRFAAWSLLVLLGIMGSSLAQSAERAVLAKMQEQMFGPVVQLERNCSGTVFYSGPTKPADDGDKTVTLILTAKHCIDGAIGTFIVNIPVYQGGRVVKEEAYRAKVRGSAYSADLAVVELIDAETVLDNLVTLAPADVTPVEGEDVWTVGYSSGLVRTVTEGLFGSREWFEFEGKEREYFRATPQVVGGNSGGALFRRNEAGGYEQAGVTVLYMPQTDFIVWYVPIDQIRDYLKTAAPEFKQDGAAARVSEIGLR